MMRKFNRGFIFTFLNLGIERKQKVSLDTKGVLLLQAATEVLEHGEAR
jgi:hypothetical protein